MKLRLQSNSVRLRLKRGEVDRLVREGRLNETIVFGLSPSDSLRYVLELSNEIATPCAFCKTNDVHIQVPAAMARAWASGSDIGIESEQAAGGNLVLRIVIEKDFACLDGTDEQNFDTFPNPLAGTKC
jgi:hypothetical protein